MSCALDSYPGDVKRVTSLLIPSESEGLSLFGKPIDRQIQPACVVGFDQPDLLLPGPAFDLTLTLKCASRAGSVFEVDQPIDAILASKAWHYTMPMLMNAADQVPGDACV